MRELLYKRGFHFRYCNPGGQPLAKEVTGPRVEPPIAILLNGHVVKWLSIWLHFIPMHLGCSQPWHENSGHWKGASLVKELRKGDTVLSPKQ